MHPRDQLGLGNITEVPCSAACPASQASALAVLHTQLVLWGDEDSPCYFQLYSGRLQEVFFQV